MRCYFVRGGHIFAVEVLRQGMSDADAISASANLLRKRVAEKQVVDGFEVWDQARFVYRFPANGSGDKIGAPRTSAA